jgi:hypothetical protein
MNCSWKSDLVFLISLDWGGRGLVLSIILESNALKVHLDFVPQLNGSRDISTLIPFGIGYELGGPPLNMIHKFSISKFIFDGHHQKIDRKSEIQGRWLLVGQGPVTVHGQGPVVLPTKGFNLLKFTTTSFKDRTFVDRVITPAGKATPNIINSRVALLPIKGGATLTMGIDSNQLAITQHFSKHSSIMVFRHRVTRANNRVVAALKLIKAGSGIGIAAKQNHTPSGKLSNNLANEFDNERSSLFILSGMHLRGKVPNKKSNINVRSSDPNSTNTSSNAAIRFVYFKFVVF